MNLIFVCQSTNRDDPIIADTFHRVRMLANHPKIKNINVVSLRGNETFEHEKIRFFSLNTNSGSKVVALFKLWSIFFRKSWNKEKKIIYFYMTPTLICTALPFKFLFKFKVIAWFAHTQYRFFTKLNLRYFCDRWLSVEERQTLPFPHLRIIGQGVNTEEFFHNPNSEKKFDLITIGRITQVKNFELILESMGRLKLKSLHPSLVICGSPYLKEDHYYLDKLKKEVTRLGLENQVTWAGSVTRKDLPKVFNSARFFVYSDPAGIGKVTVEAMACGLPLILAFSGGKSFLGDEIHRESVCIPNVDELTKKIEAALQLDIIQYKSRSDRLLNLVGEKYSLERFIDRLVEECIRD